MRRIFPLALVVAGCAPVDGPPDAAPRDGSASDALARDGAPSDALAWPDALDLDAGLDAGADANDSCIVDYNVGRCIATASCSSMAGLSSSPGHCPGPADIQCCAPTPDLATNPPIPSGYRLMMQSEVTPAMTDWAVAILHDGATYPMFSTPTMTFGVQLVLARVEWHPPDFQNAVVHRGVTLYVPV